MHKKIPYYDPNGLEIDANTPSTSNLYSQLLEKRAKEKAISAESKKEKKKKSKKRDYDDDLPSPFELGRFMDFDHSYEREGNSIPRRNWLGFREDDGFFFGMKRILGRNIYIGKRQTEDGHILIVGPPGSGKTTGLVLPSLSTWNGRIIALDLKGDGGDLVGPWFDLNRPKGKHLKVFNPTKDYSARYDPYAFLRYDGEENLVHNAQDLALAILPMPPGITENKVWIKLAQNLLTGSILYYYGIGATFNETMVGIQSYSVKELVEKISTSGNKIAAMYVSKLKGLKPEILAGIGMDFGEFVTLAVDPLVRSAFSTEGATDVINWSDFNSNENVYDVILQIPEDKLEQWEPMTTLMLSQFTKTMERRPDKHSAIGRTLQPILALLDEFPRLGTSHVIKNGLATLRSRGVTFALFIQNLAQLDERYGENGKRNILGCCPYKALLGVTEPDDQEYFSRAIGTVKVGQRSISANLDRDRELLGYGASISEARERIIEPEELGTLKNDFVLLTPDGFCRVSKVSFHDESLLNLLSPPLIAEPLTGFSYNLE